MNTTANKEPEWNVLLDRIDMGRIIPVIGQGLYWVRTSEDKEVLLYHHLAEKLAKEINFPPPAQTNHAFSKMVLRYLKENPYEEQELRRFLSQIVDTLYPIQNGPLWKLAQIKPFSLFINTTYDHFLETTLNRVRKYPTRILNHTFKEKQTYKLTQELFDELEESHCSLLFHIYGSMRRNISPAYTENDILETVFTFQNDMEKEPNNVFFSALKEKSFLFIGCEYDDWLFRFFIRAITNELYQFRSVSPTRKFISDAFSPFRHGELAYFLKSYNSEVFYADKSKDFVDILFRKVRMKGLHHIIPPKEFPETAFISFYHSDRGAARQLTSHLRKDGIRVWLDEREFKPGDGVDKTIVTAIGKCPAFIPLISKSTKRFRKNGDNLNYHIREWERAYSENVAGNNPRFIMPVIIDSTDWMYGPFKGSFFVHIPSGNKGGSYDKLRKRLLQIQDNLRLP